VASPAMSWATPIATAAVMIPQMAPVRTPGRGACLDPVVM
jgi:hypothetical protein